MFGLCANLITRETKKQAAIPFSSNYQIKYDPKGLHENTKLTKQN